MGALCRWMSPPRDGIELRSRPATAHRLLSPGNQLGPAILQNLSDELGAGLIVNPHDVRIVLNRTHENSLPGTTVQTRLNLRNRKRGRGEILPLQSAAPAEVAH